MTDFKMVPLNEIMADPNQPRKYYDEVAMEELIDSILAKDVLQPILIRPHQEGGYLLVCGERRFRAKTAVSKMTKEEIETRMEGQPYAMPTNTIPAVIRELSNEEALELQIIENLQRKDVHPIEEAIAFKSLIDNSKDLSEIAARVGKSPFYVRQRIKLCSLIQEWQQAYFAKRISSKFAMALCAFEDKIQHDIWKERGSAGDHQIEYNEWVINKYRCALNYATFNLSDDTLDNNAGACINCQFNSAVASLFPDAAENPICNKAACYKNKTELHFTRSLNLAKEDPEVIFVNTQYWSTEDNLVTQLQKEGHTVLNGHGRDHFEVIEQPEKPLLENYHPDEYDDEADRIEDYQDDLTSYESELKDYNTKMAGGKYIKAFTIYGDEKGKYVYIQLKKGSKGAGGAQAVKEKEAAGKLTTNDVTGEIKRVETLEKRKKELDTNKVHKAILEALAKNKEVKKVGIPHQGNIDRSIMVYLLLHEVSGAYILSNVKSAIKGIPAEPPYGKVGYAFDYFTALGELTDDDIALIIRHIVIAKWGGINMQGDVHAQDTPVRLIAEYTGVNIAAFEADQAAIATKRQVKVNSRLADLEAKKKELSKNKKQEKKNTKPASSN
jgi:ParB family chromosome partitioning protein